MKELVAVLVVVAAAAGILAFMTPGQNVLCASASQRGALAQVTERRSHRDLLG